jgi:hypothetical protein
LVVHVAIFWELVVSPGLVGIVVIVDGVPSCQDYTEQKENVKEEQKTLFE